MLHLGYHQELDKIYPLCSHSIGTRFYLRYWLTLKKLFMALDLFCYAPPYQLHSSEQNLLILPPYKWVRLIAVSLYTFILCCGSHLVR